MVNQKLREWTITIGSHSITLIYSSRRSSEVFIKLSSNSLFYKSIMSLESSDKELKTALERLAIMNKIAPINNENNVTFLTQNVFDAIDSIRLKKKRPDLESISDHVKKTSQEFDKNSVEKGYFRFRLAQSNNEQRHGRDWTHFIIHLETKF